MNATKRYLILLALTISLSLSGLAYAHWSDTVYIEGTVKMAHIEMTIKSYKVLTSKEIEKYSEISADLSGDGHYLTITCDNLRPCWFVWVGLVIQNQGTLSAWVKPPAFHFEGAPDLKQYFENSTYFYGPYPESTGFGTLEVWGNVKVGSGLLPDGTVTFTTPSVPTPFVADPGEKAVIWIWIHVKVDVPPDAQGETIEIIVELVDDMAV